MWYCASNQWESSMAIVTLQPVENSDYWEQWSVYYVHFKYFALKYQGVDRCIVTVIIKAINSYKRKQRHCKQQWTVLAGSVSRLDKQGGSKGVGFPRCATDEDSETPTRTARKSWASWSKQYRGHRKYNNLHKKSSNTPMSRSPTKIERTQPQDIRPQSTFVDRSVSRHVAASNTSCQTLASKAAVCGQLACLTSALSAD